MGSKDMKNILMNRQLNFAFYDKVLYKVLKKFLRCNNHHQYTPSLFKRRNTEWSLISTFALKISTILQQLLHQTTGKYWIERKVGVKGLRSYMLLHSIEFSLQNIPCPWFPIGKVQRTVSSTKNQFHPIRGEYIIYFLTPKHVLVSRNNQLNGIID